MVSSHPVFNPFFRFYLFFAADGSMAKSEQENAGGSSPFLLMIMLMLAVTVGMRFMFPPTKDSASGDKQPGVGRELVDLQLQPLTGNGLAISKASLKGKVTLVNFWGTWCPPCREEFPELAELHNSFKDKPGFQFLSVSCSSDGEGEETGIATSTAAFMKSQKADFPTYRDAWQKSRTFVGQSIEQQGFAYPTTILVDGNGIIQGFWSGYVPTYIRDMHSKIEIELNRAEEKSEPAKNEPTK